MNIIIMGAPMTCGNRGVLALGASLANLCVQTIPDASLTLLLLNRDDSAVPIRIAGKIRLVPVVNARMSPRSRLRSHLFWILLMALLYRLIPLRTARGLIEAKTPWIRALVEADVVGDVRGGDGFSDIYSVTGFILSSCAVLTVLLVKGTIMQFPQTFGPYRTRIARALATFILRQSNPVLARDHTSKTVAERLIGAGRQVTLCPDVAFSLESTPPPAVVLAPAASRPCPQELIGLNINGLLYNKAASQDNSFRLRVHYPSFIVAVAEALLRESGGDLWLIPHTFANGTIDSDPEACVRVRDAVAKDLQPRVHIVCREYNQHELKGIIGLCDFVVGSRMHACIAALSQGIPCVGVAYSRKFKGVFATAGMGEWVVDATEMSNGEAIRRIVELYRTRSEARQRLRKTADEAQHMLAERFKAALESCVGRDRIQSPRPDIPPLSNTRPASGTNRL